MIRPIAYEGTEPYIFISYAHKDSDWVLPIISGLQESGFRVWYDADIEAGSEWPEYIAEHLEGCTVFLSFLSQAALDSVNCRQEINFAIEERKETLVVYLEEIRLTAGMRMRLGVLQAIYANRHSSTASFLEELCRSRILSPCRTAADQFALPESVVKDPFSNEPTPTLQKPDLKALSELFIYTQFDDGRIEIRGLKDRASTEVEIPWGVTNIGEHAFNNRTPLTAITIPNSVTTIGNDAFTWCENLTIHGQRGSAAERYAIEKKIPFVAI